MPRVLDTAAGPVEVAELGEGPAVLVVHGTPGDWSQALALADDLKRTHRVLLPSRPGYGRTPLATGRSPRQQAAAHAALLDRLAVEQAAVVGISGGGPSARSFAVHHPQRCSSLVLVCAVAPHLVTIPRALRVLGAAPPVWAAGARVAAWRKRRGLVDARAALAAALADLGPVEREAVEADATAQEAVLAFGHHNTRALTSVPGLRNDFAWFQAVTEREPWPDGSRVRVLVLHGELDSVVPVAHAHDHVQGIPGAELDVIPGVGHAFPLTLRRAVSARIAAFVGA